MPRKGPVFVALIPMLLSEHFNSIIPALKLMVPLPIAMPVAIVAAGAGGWLKDRDFGSNIVRR
ncbi:MAG: hypothetical protein JXK94_03525 [Deltaproteobacteria bacterium]|nr:hypothetical protein [Deltaproteobacteria bacterium]